MGKLLILYEQSVNMITNNKITFHVERRMTAVNKRLSSACHREGWKDDIVIFC